jgi:hypothetical protein
LKNFSPIDLGVINAIRSRFMAAMFPAVNFEVKTSGALLRVR